jgi:hypothetical protein
MRAAGAAAHVRRHGVRVKDASDHWRARLKDTLAEELQRDAGLRDRLRWSLTEAALQECVGARDAIEKTEAWPKGSGYDYALTDNSGEVTRERLNTLSYRLGDLPVRVETDSFGDDVWLNVVVRWPS